MFEVNKKTLFRIFLGAAGCIILYWLLNERENVKVVFNTVLGILSPFITGGCIAFVLNVPMRFFENKLTMISGEGLRRTVALLLTFVAVLLVLGGVFLLLIPQLVETTQLFLPAVYDFVLEISGKVNAFLVENPEVMSIFSNPENSSGFDLTTIVQNISGVLGNSVSKANLPNN